MNKNGYMYRRYCRSLEDIYDLFLFPYWPDNPSNTVYFLEPGLKFKWVLTAH